MRVSVVTGHTCNNGNGISFVVFGFFEEFLVDLTCHFVHMTGRWCEVLSAAGAWQKLHFTPNAVFHSSMTLCSSSPLIFFGRTLRFLGPSSGGLVAAIPTTINAKSAATMMNFLCCISDRNYWSPEFKERRVYNGAIFYNILTIGPRDNHFLR